MNEFDKKSNNEILLDIKQMQMDYDALKLKMLRDYDILEIIEKRFYEANNILNKRLTGK